ncbi:MAG: STAS domain-containing protein [Myxococcota bacterium]|nr:hypothetical protein [Myxococcota bacterium]
MSLRIERSTNDGVTTLTLHGAIDENAELASLPKVDAAKVIIDMTAVDRINSVGINRWLPIMRELSSKRTVSVVRLSYAASLQASSISDLFASAEILSCLAPYYCARCGATPTIEVTAQEYRDVGQPPAKSCPSCSGALEFDELEEYLSFLARSKS